MFNLSKINRKLWYFSFNEGEMASINVLWTLESLKSLHAYPSHLLNFFGILLFFYPGFRVIDRVTLRNTCPPSIPYLIATSFVS